MPLTGMGRRRGAPSWMAGKFVSALAGGGGGSPSSSEDEGGGEQKQRKWSRGSGHQLNRVLEKWAEGQGGGGALLSRLVKPHQLAEKAAAIIRVSAEVQTSNDLTDIIHFLEIPQGRQRLAGRKDSDAQTEISYSSTSLYHLPPVHRVRGRGDHYLAARNLPAPFQKESSASSVAVPDPEELLRRYRLSQPDMGIHSSGSNTPVSLSTPTTPKLQKPPRPPGHRRAR